jgi:hypothetical protein
MRPVGWKRPSTLGRGDLGGAFDFRAVSASRPPRGPVKSFALLRGSPQYRVRSLLCVNGAWAQTDRSEIESSQPPPEILPDRAPGYRSGVSPADDPCGPEWRAAPDVPTSKPRRLVAAQPIQAQRGSAVTLQSSSWKGCGCEWSGSARSSANSVRLRMQCRPNSCSARRAEPVVVPCSWRSVALASSSQAPMSRGDPRRRSSGIRAGTDRRRTASVRILWWGRAAADRPG